jgi:8-amino-7-oxononanoate synthase
MVERWLQQQANKRLSRGLQRTTTARAEAQLPYIKIKGKKLLNFSSNDYLGLSQHPQVIAALQAAASEYGVGSAASALVSGYTECHAQLEETLAELTGFPSVMVVGNGYMANLAWMSSLLQRGTRLWMDRENHASLWAGAQLCRAKILRYGPVKDMDFTKDFSGELQQGDYWVSDGVFSMSGAKAPLRAINAMLSRVQGHWICDDSHGFAVLGRGLQGSLGHHGMAVEDCSLYMSGFGKALGSYGAMLAGSKSIIAHIRATASSYIHSTALPPALCAATEEAARLAFAADPLRVKLGSLREYLHHQAKAMGISLLPSMTPIQGVLLGCPEKALQLSAYAESKGILFTAIRPPTVPEGQSICRIILSARHECRHIDQLLRTLKMGLQRQ